MGKSSDVNFRRFQDAESFLNKRIRFGIKLGLDQTRELLARLGNPEQGLRFVHIAGTNGKGSVAAMLSSALTAAGLKTGLYTSPHLISVRERFRINGKAIREDEFVRIMSEIAPCVEAMQCNGGSPTYFELTTVLAALWFSRSRADIVIWETGMGGRFDSTNVVDPLCSVITGIGLDHCEHLGNTLAKIAFEKAGIIKPGRPVFCGPLSPSAATVIRQQSEMLGAPLNSVNGKKTILKKRRIFRESRVCGQEFAYEGKTIRLPLPGKAQAANAATALAVLEYLCRTLPISFEKAISGLEQTRWPGRFQQLSDGTIVDGAHNPQGIKALSGFLSEYFPGERVAFVFGSFADKNAADSIQSLVPHAARFLFVPMGTTHRVSHSAEALAALLHSMAPAIPTDAACSVGEALRIPTLERKVVAGSLFLAGEALATCGLESELLDLTTL
jgi:dihydrofolate synthase/folylpolyglutamate synthase